MVLLLSASLLVGAAAPPAVQAQRQHTVRQGQNLARIAKRYQVDVHALMAANRLQRDAHLQPGTVLVVPDPNEIYVRHGESLNSIARDRRVAVEELASANRLRPGAALREGQRLVMPGYSEPGATVPRGWGRARRPGIATFQLGGPRPRRVRVRLVDWRGRVPRTAVARVELLMRPRDSHTRLNPPQRLLKLLARVSDHFGGRTVHVMSGVRVAGGYTSARSRHTLGHAMDLRIDGVPNTALRDYCRTLPQAGVGYYPRSTFVHLDVRDESAYWVDWSRHGEAPQYQRPGQSVPADVQGEQQRDEDEATSDSDPALETDNGAPAPAEPSAAPAPEASPATP